MLRRLLCTGIAFVLMVGLALADEFKATVKKVDADSNTVILTVNDEEKTYDVSKDADIYVMKKVKKKDERTPISGGLSGLKNNSEVTVTTIKKEGKEIVVGIKLEGMAKKKK
jgi:hypothetical protein